ncbi:MAG: hypothetical protein IH606_10700 [Burkholderiales bacterium]|nr:hypothetical protein [Burkholderiales bacterium]
MNLGTGAARRRYSVALRPDGQAEAQLSLPLDTEPCNEAALRAAWSRSRLPIPYHLALRNRPLAICLSCLADAMRRKSGADGSRAGGSRAGGSRGPVPRGT